MASGWESLRGPDSHKRLVINPELGIRAGPCRLIRNRYYRCRPNKMGDPQSLCQWSWRGYNGLCLVSQWCIPRECRDRWEACYLGNGRTDYNCKVRLPTYCFTCLAPKAERALLHNQQRGAIYTAQRCSRRSCLPVETHHPRSTTAKR